MHSELIVSRNGNNIRNDDFIRNVNYLVVNLVIRDNAKIFMFIIKQ